MNKISVSTQARSDGQFDVAYRIHEVHPLANGIVQVSVASHYTADRAIIAELAALRYLLCEANVCGSQRTGKGLQWFASTILAGRRQLSWPVKRSVVNPSFPSFAAWR